MLIDIIAYLSLYPVLIVVLVTGAVICSVAFNFGAYLAETTATATPTQQVFQLAALPTIQPPLKQGTSQTTDPVIQPTPSSLPPTVAQAATLSAPVSETASPIEPTNVVPSATPEPVPDSAPQPPQPVAASPTATPEPLPTLNLAFFNSTPTPHTPHSTATPTTPRRGIDNLLNSLMGDSGVEAAETVRKLPTLTATPTLTPSPSPSPTPTPTHTPTETPLPTDTATFTPTPTATPYPTDTPLPTNTPLPTDTPVPTPVPLPTATPLPTSTPLPQYDFLLNEFFNSPTSNSFLVMYVAIVDNNEIPIGDLKIVGTRLDHNLTYESPLSTWHYEGYNAPGEVLKSGNVKFEPPGGIENTSWIVYLADANGNRLSDDVPFNTSIDQKQWYFLKFRRQY
jgi:hypothetical protein